MPLIRVLTPQEAEGAAGQILSVYQAAFSMPPYRESDRNVAWFAGSFRQHTRRVGFRCVAAKEAPGSPVIGFAYGFTSQPGHWWREVVADALGPDPAERWLGDAFAFAELAVDPAFQGRGYGGRLHDALLENLPHRTAVLSTIMAETTALRLYRKRGWSTLLSGFFFPGVDDPYLILGKEVARPKPSP
jgi:GNAT superfamily N-acetyltransferase